VSLDYQTMKMPGASSDDSMNYVIHNQGSSPIALSALTVRYWFGAGNGPWEYICDYGSAGLANAGPTPLDGKPLAFDSPTDRRAYLADWLTSAENPYFAKALANRVWANYMGRGLVEMVDDLRATNPSSNEVLLAALAACR